MGKRPIIGFLGLVVAGIALTGCGETGKHNNMRPGKYGSKGAFDKPTPLPPAAPAPSAVSDSRPPAPTGTKPTDLKPEDKSIVQTSASGIPAGVQPADPNSIGVPAGEALKPLPSGGTSFDRAPAGDPIARGTESVERSTLPPPRPVRNTFGSTTTSALPERRDAGAPLPPVGTAPATTGAPQGLPPSAMPPVTPASGLRTDMPPAPLPPSGGMVLPPLPGT